MHYYFGIAVLALIAVRLALLLRNGASPPPWSSRAIERAGRITHWLFYALLVLVPVMGLMGYYFGDPHTLAGHEGLAQTQTRAVQETALLPSAM